MSDEMQPPASTEEQQIRRAKMLEEMMNAAMTSVRAANFVHTIIEQNQDRMVLGEDGQLFVLGTLATYSVDLNAFLDKYKNPFGYHSFDTVKIHPRNRLVEKPEPACVQVRVQNEMPAFDLLGAYVLGLMNDERNWLEHDMRPLRDALFRIYGYARSPLTRSLEEYMKVHYQGVFNHEKGTFSFQGSNGWRWRLSFSNPLSTGMGVQYQKPRQTWWNHLLHDHIKELTGHYDLSGFFSSVEYLSQSPGNLRNTSSWECDPIFKRKLALIYPPLQREMVDVLTQDNYTPEEIYTFYDEPISGNEVTAVRLLDDEILSMAVA